jgi:hypothetical protein
MAEIRRNCWTCAYNLRIGDRYSCDSEHDDVWRWQEDTPLDDALMPAKDAPPCPGWEVDTTGDEPPAPDGLTVGEAPAVATMPDDALNVLERFAAIERRLLALESPDAPDTGD